MTSLSGELRLPTTYQKTKLALLITVHPSPQIWDRVKLDLGQGSQKYRRVSS
jgi:hypothetical protein